MINQHYLKNNGKGKRLNYIAEKNLKLLQEIVESIKPGHLQKRRTIIRRIMSPINTETLRMNRLLDVAFGSKIKLDNE